MSVHHAPDIFPAVITPGSGKALGKDAAFEVFAKSLAHMLRGDVVVALACAGEFMPGLEVFGDGLVEQLAL
jgi:hypothetical protein